MNFAKFLRTTFLQNTSGRLFLCSHGLIFHYTLFDCTNFSWNQLLVNSNLIAFKWKRVTWWIFCQNIWNIHFFYKQLVYKIITRLSEICLTSLIALFWNFPLMICNFPLFFSHSENILMSTLITIIITY